MKFSEITKSNTFKVVLFFLLFIALIGSSSILFIRSLKFWAVPLLRALYIAVSIIWTVGSIWWVVVRFNFRKYWNGMRADIWNRQNEFERDLVKDYQELMRTYPLAIASFESKCWRRDPRPTSPEIMEEALLVTDEEWAEREKVAKERLKKKREYTTNN